MSRRRDRRGSEDDPLPAPDFFDLEGSDPELLNSGRIPDPQPEHTPLFRWLARVLTAVEARLRARGDTGVRMAIRFAWLLLAGIGLFLLAGPVINKPLDFEDVLASAKVSEVDWIATDAVVDYSVSRTRDRGFAAEVSESYTANFTNGPESSIERRFVTEFSGHDTGFEVRSATIDGVPAEVDVIRGATVTRVVVSRPDGEELAGERRIELDYAMRDLVTVEEDQATGREVDVWSWPLLGPSWPQATKGVEVSLTLPAELDDALVRKPRAYVGWLLLSGTEWLEPEGETAEGVRYAFSNDDTLPPYPDLIVETSFEPGTFAQPPTTALFWWQTWGPLLPLALLAAMLLFALAARRVVWADSAGESWYLARSEPPSGLDPGEAAQLLDRARHAELLDALAGSAAAGAVGASSGEKVRKRSKAPGSGTRERWLTAVARAGMRAGRLGNFPSVLATRRRWAKADAPVENGLRWAPDSYVRDTFVYGSVAITLIQWGLLRQLSAQVILLVVWWPALFVLASTVLAAAILLAVRRPRPLTPEGALVMQQLKGIDAYARATRVLDRGPVDHPLLPYALLFAGPRRAGRKVAEHAGREAGDALLGRGWRTESFVSLPAILALLASAAVLAGSIVTVSTQPAPYDEEEFLTWPSSEVSGAAWSQIEGFDVEGTLERDERGGARLSVVEHDRVSFAAGGKVPQLVREWPSERLGQDLGLEVESVRIDGAEVPFRTIGGRQSIAMATQLSDVLDGRYDVEIAYSLSAPVVEAPNGPDSIQQLRWTAWYSFWEDTYYTNLASLSEGSAPVRPIRIQLTIAPDIAGEIRSGGWIAYDDEHEGGDVPYENGEWHRDWVYDNSVFLTDDLGAHKSYELRIGSEQTLDDGSLRVAIDADAVESREEAGSSEDQPAAPWQVSEEINGALGQFELGLTTDLGAVLDFAPGTFADVDPGAYERYRTDYWTPYGIALGADGFIILASAGVLAFALRTRRRASISLRLVSACAIPLLAVGQSVLFWWVVGSMRGGSGAGWGAILLGAVMLVAVVAQAIAVAGRGGGRRTGSGRSGRSEGSQRSERSRDARGEAE